MEKRDSALLRCIESSNVVAAEDHRLLNLLVTLSLNSFFPILKKSIDYDEISKTFMLLTPYDIIE